jgi:hypothetical protein
MHVKRSRQLHKPLPRIWKKELMPATVLQLTDTYKCQWKWECCLLNYSVWHHRKPYLSQKWFMAMFSDKADTLKCLCKVWRWIPCIGDNTEVQALYTESIYYVILRSHVVYSFSSALWPTLNTYIQLQLTFQ